MDYNLTILYLAVFYLIISVVFIIWNVIEMGKIQKTQDELKQSVTIITGRVNANGEMIEILGDCGNEIADSLFGLAEAEKKESQVLRMIVDKIKPTDPKTYNLPDGTKPSPQTVVVSAPVSNGASTTSKIPTKKRK